MPRFASRSESEFSASACLAAAMRSNNSASDDATIARRTPDERDALEAAAQTALGGLEKPQRAPDTCRAVVSSAADSAALSGAVQKNNSEGHCRANSPFGERRTSSPYSSRTA